MSGRPTVDTRELPVVRVHDEPDPVRYEPPSQPAPRPGRARRPWGRGVGVGVLLTLAAAAGVGVGVQGTASQEPGPAAGAASPAPVEPASIESLDPSGGSGFRQDEDGWRTQTYRSAEFGNLKDGVGLLVDAGAATALTSVALQEATPGLTVELLASDSPSQDIGDYEVLDRQKTSGGTTALDATGTGPSRYWLIWVTELAPSEGGFAAEIAGVEMTRGAD